MILLKSVLSQYRTKKQKQKKEPKGEKYKLDSGRQEVRALVLGLLLTF